jgi:hypothetical protein
VADREHSDPHGTTINEPLKLGPKLFAARVPGVASASADDRDERGRREGDHELADSFGGELELLGGFLHVAGSRRGQLTARAPMLQLVLHIDDHDAAVRAT